MHNRILLIATAAILVIQGSAQIDRSKAPEPGKPTSIRLAAPKVQKMKNGMTLVLVEDHKLPMVSCQLQWDVEPMHQADATGTIALVGELLGAGTRNYNKAQLDEMVDALGADLFTYTNGIYASGLSKSTQQLLALVAEMATNSTFPQAELDKAKARMESAISMGENDPNTISNNVGDVLRFSKAHPYGSLTTMESLSKVTRAHLLGYYKKWLVPERAYLVLVGDFDAKKLVSYIERAFVFDGEGRKMQLDPGASLRESTIDRTRSQERERTERSALNSKESSLKEQQIRLERSEDREKGQRQSIEERVAKGTTASAGPSKEADISEAVMASAIKNFRPASSIGKWAPLPKENHVAIVDRPDAVQSVIEVTYPVYLPPNHPDALAVRLMSNILGGGAFNSRLNQNLREEHGFTYSAYASLDTDEHVGAFSAGASVRTEVTDSAITEILTEMQSMLDELVTKEELTLAKNMIAGAFARSMEDPRTIARFALNTILFDLAPDHYQTYLQRLDSLTAEDVRAMAEMYIKPQNAHILVVGKKEDVYNKLLPFGSIYGGVEQLDIYGDRYREHLDMPPPGLTANQVIDDYITAIGGRGKTLGLKSELVTMTATMQGKEVELKNYRKYPDLYRSELTTAGSVLNKVIYDGQRGVEDGMMGKTELQDLELRELGYEAVMFPELKYQEWGFDVMLLGVATINGVKAYKLNVITMDGLSFVEYYDTVTKLKIRQEKQVPSRETRGTNLLVTTYDDYQDVQGILYPHKVTQNAGMKMTFTVTKVEHDVKLEEDLFQVN